MLKKIIWQIVSISKSGVFLIVLTVKCNSYNIEDIQVDRVQSL